jgi:hypothetical protein
MICDRCQQPMRDEEAKPYDVFGASGAGTTIYVHKQPCSPPVSAQPRTYSPRRP